MKQAHLDIGPAPKRTRRQEFLDQMQRVVPWSTWLALIEPHMPQAGAKGGRPPVDAEVLLRIHLLQQWFALSDLAAEEALHEQPSLREFALLRGSARIPDESTILRFRHMLEAHGLSKKLFDALGALLTQRGLMLKGGSIVDATLIAAPSSTKNSSGQRDPDMHQSKKGNQWHFGMKAHIGVDMSSGLVHSVEGTAGNVHDVTQAHKLLHGQESQAFADSGYRGVDKRKENQGKDVQWNVAMMPSKRTALDANDPGHQVLEGLEHLKASVRAQVEHAFQVLKVQFGYRKVRYRGLAKNTAQLFMLFALVNLKKVRQFACMQNAGPKTA